MRSCEFPQDRTPLAFLRDVRFLVIIFSRDLKIDFKSTQLANFPYKGVKKKLKKKKQQYNHNKGIEEKRENLGIKTTTTKK